MLILSEPGINRKEVGKDPIPFPQCLRLPHQPSIVAPFGNKYYRGILAGRLSERNLAIGGIGKYFEMSD